MYRRNLIPEEHLLLNWNAAGAFQRFNHGLAMTPRTVRRIGATIGIQPIDDAGLSTGPVHRVR